MRLFSFPENRATKAAIGAALLALLLFTRDSMYSMMVWDFYTCQFLSLGIIAMMGLSFLWVNRKNLKEVFTDSRMVCIFAVLLVMLLPMAVKQDWQLMYFSILLVLLFAIFLTYFVTMKDVARWYVVTMCILGVWSVLCAYVLRIFIDTGMVTPTPVTNSMDVVFYNFVFSIVPESFVKLRNFGIFREPGVYQFFLLIALFLNNYVIEWNKKKFLWIANGILAVTMLSTFATGGLIELFLLAVVLFVDKKWYRNKWVVAGTIAGIAVLIIGLCSLSPEHLLYWYVRDVFAKFTENPESTGSRLASIALGVELFFRSPFVGEPVQTVLHSIVDYSASTLILYNIFGILGGTLNVAGWVALVWSKERKVIVNLMLLLILFMSFNTQNLTWNLFFWLFPGMALTERLLPVVAGFLNKKKV